MRASRRRVVDRRARLARSRPTRRARLLPSNDLTSYVPRQGHLAIEHQLNSLPMSSKRHVIVLGAGVTGLTSAIFLTEAGYEVTIIAAHVPGDTSIEYTSPW